MATEPLNVVVPPEFKLSLKDSSLSEELQDSVQNLKQVAIEEFKIEEESTLTKTPIPIQKTYTGESSKIKNLPTQEEMTAMLATVHKLIDEMTEKTTTRHHLFLNLRRIPLHLNQMLVLQFFCLC